MTNFNIQKLDADNWDTFLIQTPNPTLHTTLNYLSDYLQHNTLTELVDYDTLTTHILETNNAIPARDITLDHIPKEDLIDWARNKGYKNDTQIEEELEQLEEALITNHAEDIDNNYTDNDDLHDWAENNGYTKAIKRSW